jgi:hypothetical protein
VVRMHFLMSCLCLSFLMAAVGCNSSMSGSLQEISATSEARSSSGGDLYSPAKPQKTTTRTLSGNISKYTVYLSVGSSQVAAQ